MIHAEMLIDGHFIGGPCDQATGKAVVKNPYDGSVVGTYAEGGLGELRGCLDSADRAFRNWHPSIQERQQLLRRISDLVRERKDELVELLALEVGKPVTWGRGEVERMAITFGIAADVLESWPDSTQPALVEFPQSPESKDARAKDYQAAVARFPIGPIFGIVPYNWPYNLAAHKIAPALAIGNTIILKPSPQAAICTFVLARLIHEAGCPPGVLNAWCGPDQVIEKVSHDPRCRMISFTGSPGVGWKVKKGLPPDKKVALELGGNGMAIICEDADLEWAADRCVMGGYGYAGQVCIAVQHVICHSSVYDRVRDLLSRKTNECIYGDPRDTQTVCGPMISSEAADRVEMWIEEATESGARVLAGGEREGNVIRPTLIEAVPEKVRLSNEEVFGPVLTLEAFDDISQALSRVNASPYGIHLGLFTKRQALIDETFHQAEVGGLVINDFPTLRFDHLPYGGVKQSGFGREGVRYAMEEMSEWKSLVTKKS